MDDQLRNAAERGETEKVQELIAIGANVHTTDSNGITALMNEAWKGQMENLQ